MAQEAQREFSGIHLGFVILWVIEFRTPKTQTKCVSPRRSPRPFLKDIMNAPSLFPRVVAILSTSMVLSVAKSKRPEVGDVAWRRDFDAALAESKSTGKPVFAFFQEVPG